MNSTTILTCCICLSEYAPHESPFELSCGHRVHSGCMLRLCLSHGDDARCPYCRAQVSTGADEDSDTEDESIDTSSEDLQEMLPQWRRLTWFRPASRNTLRVRGQVMKRLFQRARNKLAPAVLKRCAEEHKRLNESLLTAKKEEAKYKSGRSQKTVKGTLAELKQRETAIRKAEHRVEVHLKRAWLRCTNSSAVIDYLKVHPLAEVT